MNFNTGMKLPTNFGNQNRGFNNPPRMPNGINNNIANKVNNIKAPERTFKSIDGTTWSTFEEASNHNKRYYYDQQNFKNNKF